MPFDVLPLDDVTLRYKLEGAGPLLLILQAGDGDADASNALSARLADSVTVLTYDRYGISDSRASELRVSSVGTHAQDVVHLLQHLKAPSFRMIGVSIGAMIGLEVVSRVPECIEQFIAFEAPTIELLPDMEQRAAEESQISVERAFADGGIAAGMKRFAELGEFDPADHEPGITMPSFSPHRLANLTFFLKHDAPAVRQHRFHWQRVLEAREKIEVARGRKSQGSMPGRCTEALAKFLGKEVIEFDGGHNAYVTRPSAFSDQLKRLFRSTSAE